MTVLLSRPYRPAMACEACCFGGSTHAVWCSKAQSFMEAWDAVTWLPGSPRAAREAAMHPASHSPPKVNSPQ